MSAPVTKVVVLGRDAPLWLAAGVVTRALKASGVTVQAVELPSVLTPADIYPTLPPLEALHRALGVDESLLLRATRGTFSLGHNFADRAAGTPQFLHAYGSSGAAIDGADFFAYWLKARHFGLAVGFEDFSLTASAARHGRMMIPDDETEVYARCDYGYHLPALAYAALLKARMRCRRTAPSRRSSWMVAAASKANCSSMRPAKAR
jgi:tryptophan halogenase